MVRLLTRFGTNGPKVVYLTNLSNFLSDFHREALIFFKELQGLYLNQII